MTFHGVDVRRQENGRSYAIPSDNPFVDQPKIVPVQYLAMAYVRGRNLDQIIRRTRQASTRISPAFTLTFLNPFKSFTDLVTEATGSEMYNCTTSSPAYFPVLFRVTVAVSFSFPFSEFLLSLMSL